MEADEFYLIFSLGGNYLSFRAIYLLLNRVLVENLREVKF